MSIAGSQQRTLLDLLSQLRPHWRTDRALPARIQTLVARNRAFGSRDRRLYRELIYTTLRYLPWVEPLLDRDQETAAQLVAWLAADIPATQKFRASVLTEWPLCPPTAAAKAKILSDRLLNERPDTHGALVPFDAVGLFPEWFGQQYPAAIFPAQIDVLLSRAPLWLRLQANDESQVLAEFERLGWRWQRSPVLASAVQLFDEVDVTKTDAFLKGLIEIQDLGSQLLLESAGIAPGGQWLDGCAGAGGKALQLSQLVGSAGTVDAFDIRAAALEELEIRTRRAGVRNVRVLPQMPGSTYDGVLLDAPCTGSGTWRRAPHLKWTTTTSQIDDAAATQRALLGEMSQRVRRGGSLVYATCSLNRKENEDAVGEFLEAHPNFRSEPVARAFGGIVHDMGLTFLPATHNTDGFFVACIKRVG